MGDFHNDSATCKLNFTDNTGIYYKPRSLEIDNAILKLGEEIERRLDRKIFYKVKNINRGNYGWSFPVKENQCQSYDEVKEYYYNMGILTSLSYFLNIEDLIYDNIISVGTKIALIDLECSLCVPRKINKTSQFVLDSISGRLFRNSVINSGIIPRFTYEDRYNDGQSDASLSYIQERKGFYNKLTFNETRVKFEIIHTQIKEKENHIPHYKNIPQPIEPYVNFYLKGFKNSFGFFLKNKKLLLNFIDSCRGLETRVIFRPTKIYSILFHGLISVKGLSNKNYRNKILNSFNRGIYAGIDKSIIKSEKLQIKKLNIPAFKKIIGDKYIYDFAGNIIKEIDEKRIDIFHLKNKIQNISSKEYNIQKKIIISSLNIFELENELITENSTPIIYSKKNYVETTLHSILNDIKNKLSIQEREISCLSTYSNVNNGWEYGPIGPGLSNGLDGLSLLFGAYGYLYKENEFLSISEKILKQHYYKFSKQINDLKLFESVAHILTSPFQYPLSLFYVNEVLASILGYYILPQKELSDKVSIYLNNLLSSDEHYDFLIGSCGAMFFYYQMFKKYQKHEYLELFKKLSEHIYKKSKIGKNQSYWENKKFKRLGGFSHGNSSLSLSMLLAYDLLKDKKYYTLFRQAYRYDESLFDIEKKGYLDLRYFPEKKISFGWAHGFGGIGLSRVLMAWLDDFHKEEYRKQIFLCKNKTEQALIDNLYKNNINYSLNGGFSGNIEILNIFNNYLNNDNFRTNKLFLEYIKQINKKKVILRNNHLLLNQGITGLGYSILKWLYPQKIPSILTLNIQSITLFNNNNEKHSI